MIDDWLLIYVFLSQFPIAGNLILYLYNLKFKFIYEFKSTICLSDTFALDCTVQYFIFEKATSRNDFSFALIKTDFDKSMLMFQN